MAVIIENNENSRRMIRMTSDDIINVVREYQRIVKYRGSYEEIRTQLENSVIFIPEDM